MLPLATLLFVGFLVANACPAADWPGFRGGEALGVSSETQLPTSWSQRTNLLWKTKADGWGDSSPIVLGNRVYITSQTDDTAMHVVAINRDHGKIIWSTRIGAGKLKTHELQNMATPTPVSDGEKIWALFGTGDLACVDAAGKILWQRQLQKDHGDYKIMWGMGTSPVLFRNQIFIACLHNGPSYVLAIDGKTGRDIWKIERDVAKAEAQDSYSTPIVVSSGATPQLVVSGGDHINGYDLTSGKQLWISSGLDVPHPYGRTIAGPTAGGGIIVTVASGFRNQGYVVGIKPDGQGDITSSARLWTAKRYAPDCPTPVIYDGLVYFVRDDGNASCLDLKSGEPLWQERLFSADAKVSPVAGDGKVYFLNGRANCTVVKAGGKLQILATNELNEATVSSPAVSDGKVFIRTRENLYAVGNR